MGALGVENVLKKDLENMQQQFKSNDDMASFVFDLQNKNYDVRYHTNSDNQMKTIFFIHDHGIQELRRLPECIVVDATYKTNIHKMVLLNFVVASTVSSREKPHQLATIPVAAAWMDRETADNYSWVLQQLRDIVWSPKNTEFGMEYELPSVFVTDNDASLRKGISTVFPESVNLLCYLHIEANFRKRFVSNLSTDRITGEGKPIYGHYI